MMPLLSAFAAIWLAVSISHGQGVTDRETMGGRAWTCIQARFYVAPDSTNRYSNLLNPKYQGCGGVCQNASDIYTDTRFLNGCADCDPPGGLPPSSYNWLGIPYAIPGCWHPDHNPSIQEGINQGKALGYHWCHKVCRNCPAWPGCDWGLGLSCSGFVSYCWGYGCHGTCTLQEADKSKELPSRGAMQKGSALIMCGTDDEPGHTVLFLNSGCLKVVDTFRRSTHRSGGSHPRNISTSRRSGAADEFATESVKRRKGDTPMRRIPLILATLLLTLVAGCGSAATEPLPFSQFPIDLPLVAEQEIGFHGGRDTVVTLPGETAHFDWTDGKLYLNGVTIRPLQPFQSEVPSLEALQQIYGGVPRIQELVATGAGSDHDRWYRAYLTWQQEKVDLVRATEQEFAASVVNHSTEVAAQASLNIVVAATNLVERAEVRIADPFSKIATIVLWWKGQPVEAHIEMLPDYHQFEAHLDAFYDREQALRLVRLIHLTTSTGKPCRVELGAGIWIEGYTGGNPQGAK